LSRESRRRIERLEGNKKGQPHKLVIMKVLTRDEFGRPSTVKVGYDDTKFDIGEGDEFVTGFIHEAATKPGHKGNA
jgi:hypothetical protein